MIHLNRRGKVLVNGQIAGFISEHSDLKKEHFIFEYEQNYIENGAPIGHHYPLTNEPYISDYLPPFFSNLVSEGWLLQHQINKKNINKDDYFGLLLANGSELIGAISVIPDKGE